jgi:hypothetical protein
VALGRHRFQHPELFPAHFDRLTFTNKKENHMDQNNRVLTRMGARELTEQEVETVTGAFKTRRTLTPCFVDSKQQLLNGDQAIGECGPS